MTATTAPFVVHAVPKDRDDDLTDGRGLPVASFATELEADEYVDRNSSPDNPDRYVVKTAEPPTARLRISDFVAFELSGSGISDPQANHGYDDGLVAKLSTIVPYGATLELTAAELRDLGGWAGDMTHAVAQGGNPSGARSLAALALNCSQLAHDLEADR